MTAWCDCPEPDNEGDPVRMCRRCLRKPHSECRVCGREETK